MGHAASIKVIYPLTNREVGRSGASDSEACKRTFEALLEDDLTGSEEQQRREGEEAVEQAAAAASAHRRSGQGAGGAPGKEGGELRYRSVLRAKLLDQGNICSARGE